MAYYFTPEHVGKSDLHYGAQNEHDDIIRDVYGDDMIEMDEYTVKGQGKKKTSSTKADTFEDEETGPRDTKAESEKKVWNT